MPAQQQAYVANSPAADEARGWKIFALVLLVLVGLLAGFLLAQYLQQQQEQKQTPVVVAPAPATAGQILTDLLVPVASDPTAAETTNHQAEQADDEQLLVSAQPQAKNRTQNQQHTAGQTLDEQVAVVTGDSISDMSEQQAFIQADQQFTEQPDMAEADPTDTVLETPAQQPELSASEVSDELKNKFALALEETGSAPKRRAVTDHAAPARDINSLDELLKRQIPPLRFEAHVYASEPKQRWVKVNGKDLQEGQWVTADIQIKEITPQYVLLQTGRQLFSMEALTEWSYRLPNP
jgi:hypothetical protein